MKGFLTTVFSIERKIAYDFLTAAIAHPNTKVNFYSSEDKNKAIDWLAEALKEVLDIDEYRKLSWFGENSRKKLAQKIGAAFFQGRLKSTDFPLHYYCYYIDEAFEGEEHCDYFHIHLNPVFNRHAAIQKFELFVFGFLSAHYPRLLKQQQVMQLVM
ncbi:MAG TPA: hypothetical protein VGV92_04000 [Gammaproteobacteria bacterium]|nr:hypothetical protein [Gammaproteobacteria bacterium]